MPRINPATREITCKVVYDGPWRSGKTSNLLFLQGRARPERRGSATVSRDLDFLALDLGPVSGFTVRFQLYAVPGAPRYRETRRLIFQGADGVIFVADSQARRVDDNLASLRSLETTLDQPIPLVMQYNKQDLPAELILSPDHLAGAFAANDLPAVSADALHGSGVFETFELLSGLVLQQFA